MRRTIGPGLAAASYAAFMPTMTIGRLTGNRVTARLGPVALVCWGGVVLAAGLGTVLSLGHGLTALVGFALVGVALANVVPLLFSAAGRVPHMAAEPALAAVSTASFTGFLVGPPATDLTADHITWRGGLGIVVGLGVLIALRAPVVKPADPAPLDRLP